MTQTADPMPGGSYVVGAGALNASAAVGTVLEDDTQPPQEQVSSLDHPDTVQPNGSFNVTVTTSETATSAVEVSPDGFNVDLSVVDDDGDNAFPDSGNRVEFIDPYGDGGTYVVNVNVTGASGGETGEVDAYAGGSANETDNSDALNSSFTVEDTNTGGGETPPDETETIEISHRSTVSSDGTLRVTVAMPAGSTAAVEVAPDGFGAELSVVDNGGDSLVENTGTRVEFVDIGAEESTYVLDVNVTDAEAGDTGQIRAYLGGDANQEDHTYSSTSGFNVSDLYTSPIDRISDELWTAVTRDGSLSLGDLGSAIQGYQQNGQVNGVDISLGDLGALIQHYRS